MSVFSLLAPTTTDKEYASQLISELDQKNYMDQTYMISQLVSSSKKLTRDDLISAIGKAEQLATTGYFDAAAAILLIFSQASRSYFAPSDFKSILSFLTKSTEAQQSSMVPPLMVLCEKSLSTSNSLDSIISDPNDLICFVSRIDDPSIFSFIYISAKLSPSIRIPLVFSGLVEKMLPSCAKNEKYLSLLSILLEDTQSRQYFADMGHLPQLISILFDTSFSQSSTNVFRSLISGNDLTHLSKLQDILFSINAPKQMVEAAFSSTLSDESAANAVICAADSIRYRPTQLFSLEQFLECAKKRPGIRGTLLYLLELYSISNQISNEGSDTLKDLQDQLFSLYVLFFCNESSHSKNTYLLYQASTDRTLPMELICSTQMGVLHPKAETLAKCQEDTVIQSLASINCLLSHKEAAPRNQMIHLAREFFKQNRGMVNKGDQSLQSIFYPRAFIEYGRNLFSDSNLGSWLSGSSALRVEQIGTVFDFPPDNASQATISIIKKTSAVEEGNILLQENLEALKAKQKALSKDATSIQISLLEIGLLNAPQ